ncbi:MAG: YncE family protein [Micropruina sp.]|nr:MAG: YncE family protein [Micropruina sp.]
MRDRRQPHWFVVIVISLVLGLLVTWVGANDWRFPWVEKTSMDTFATPLAPSPGRTTVSIRPSETDGDRGATEPHVVANHALGPRLVGLALDVTRGRFYVASYGEGTVIIGDLNSGNALKRIPVGRGTAGLVFDPFHSAIHTVSVNSRTVTSVDSEGLTKLGTVEASEGRGSVAVDTSTGEVYVVNQRGKSIQRVSSTGTDVLAEIDLDAIPRAVTADPNNGRVYVASADSHAVLVIDSATSRVTGRAVVGDHRWLLQSTTPEVSSSWCATRLRSWSSWTVTPCTKQGVSR